MMSDFSVIDSLSIYLFTTNRAEHSKSQLGFVFNSECLEPDARIGNNWPLLEKSAAAMLLGN